MKIIALLQARNEERFIPGWLENVSPAVDGIVALDDGSEDLTGRLLASHAKTLTLLRNPAGATWNEYSNQVSLIQNGRRHGATWFLCLDADERLEQRLVRDLRAVLVEASSRSIQAISIQIRDLWNDRKHYRVDGLWQDRSRYRIFRNIETHKKFDPRPLHRHWMPLEIVSNLNNVGINLPYAFYHLRMIKLEDRIARFRKYISIDPEYRYQRQGYHHLIDENGLLLNTIEPGRDFLPYYDQAID